MPSAARHARATPRPRPSSRPARPRSVRTQIAISRIAWDRKFRTIMLVVLALVGYLGVRGMLELMAARAQAEQQQQTVHVLARENHALEREQSSLGQAATIMRDARALGMVRAGERAYAVTGLPGR